jgi:rhamnosyltransferase
LHIKTEASPSASIVILAKNEGQNIGKCLKSLFAQRFNDFEVIFIDSGSTDNTLEIASKFPIRIFRISEKEFHHAQTRNVGISLSQGKYVVFLTADAYPFNPVWLEQLLKPFEEDEIAATYSRQISKDKTNPIETAFLLQTYPRNSKRNHLRKMQSGDPGDFVILSDVSSAYRKHLVKFEASMEFSEDQEIARRLLEAGYEIAYVPESVVCHSHNYSIASLMRRYRASGKSAARLSGNGFHPVNSLRYSVELFASSFAYVIADSSLGKRAFWFFYSIPYNGMKILWFVLGYLTSRFSFLGKKCKFDDVKMQSKREAFT